VVPESPTGPTGAIRWYERERAVLRATVRRAADLGAHLAVLLITQDWHPMSDNIDAPRELLPYLRLAIDAATSLEADPDGDVPLALIAECHRDTAAKLARTGDTDGARRHFDAALRRFDQLGDCAGQANTLRNMAVVLATDPDERVDFAARAVHAARRCDIPLVLCAALEAYGGLLRLAGRAPDALPALREGLALAEQHPGGDNLAPPLLTDLALNHAAVGDLTNAIAVGERALQAARRINDIGGELSLLPSHGDALLAAGHPARARQTWQRYLTLSANTAIAESVAHGTGRTAADTARDIRPRLAALPPDEHP
jgi:tetratricopeptide (TPR) repeat protein